ncbi:Phototropic-responsive NPH3 family protein [Perilla frutescens var. frutescens]|nr:Phototropic-responsive NPH3 family protein [Perilla frutescens var. frutescens]
MQTLAAPESTTLSGKPPACPDECWSDDAASCVLDTDYFIKTLKRLQGKGARPDLIGSIITHYASKWLPDLAGGESVASSCLKKRSFIETLVGILPQEKDSVPCNFLLRILRVANAAGVEAGCRAELEQRVSLQLDQASWRELLIPCFTNSCSTSLDFELVLRLVKTFVSVEEVARSGGALMKVAKLVDSYLAEVAVDSHLTLSQFFALASSLPSHARAADDGIYRAIDIYLKAHPSLSKQERKRLCMLIDSRKLSTEASIHAAQNERLPVRAVIQVLLSEQDKLSRHIDWSGSLSGPGIGLEATARCLSKRGMTMQHMEIKRLKEDVVLLQSQCMNMERQLEKMLEKKRGYFSWKKLGIGGAFKADKIGRVEGDGGDGGARMNTPMQMKARLVGGRSSKKWRKSIEG